MIPLAMSKCIRKLKSWGEYYVEFCTSMKYISALAITHRFLNYAVVGVLITYLTEGSVKQPVVIAAALTNLGEGLSELTLIFTTASSISHASYQKLILRSTVAYFAGLLMLCLNAYGIGFENPKALYYLYMGVIVILINFGATGSRPILDNFSKAQLWFHETRGTDIRHARLKARFRVWRFAAWLLALAPILGTSRFGWRKLFVVSAPLLAVSGLWFRWGASSYHPIRPVINPLSVVNRVVRAAASKRNAQYPMTRDDFFQSSFVSASCRDVFFRQESANEVSLLPSVRFCKWVDKAAAKEPPSRLSPEEHERKCRTVARVYGTKHVLAMVPIYVALLGFGVARATCNTFFVVQAEFISKISAPEGRDISLQTLLLINTVAQESVYYIWDLLPRWLGRTIERRYYFLKGRIVFGTFASAFGLFVAWYVARRGPMVAWLLVPQFCFSGFAEGLALDGLAELYNYRVPESMRGYGDALTGIVKGLGSLLSILCLYVFKTTCFAGEDVGSSDLPTYYSNILVLSCISFAAVLVVLGFGYTYSDIAENGFLDSEAFFMADVSEQERLQYGQVLGPMGIDPEARDGEEPAS